MCTQFIGGQMETMTRVGMREFRANLQHFLMTSAPVAITRHGETIGFYIPARHHHSEEELAALKQAALKLEKLLISSGVTEEELFQDFRSLREGEKTKK